jgi:hypothetical protein
MNGITGFVSSYTLYLAANCPLISNSVRESVTVNSKESRMYSLYDSLSRVCLDIQKQVTEEIPPFTPG